MVGWFRICLKHVSHNQNNNSGWFLESFGCSPVKTQNPTFWALKFLTISMLAQVEKVWCVHSKHQPRHCGYFQFSTHMNFIPSCKNDTHKIPFQEAELEVPLSFYSSCQFSKRSYLSFTIVYLNNTLSLSFYVSVLFSFKENH